VAEDWRKLTCPEAMDLVSIVRGARMYAPLGENDFGSWEKVGRLGEVAPLLSGLGRVQKFQR
jgi:hypothetical protein